MLQVYIHYQKKIHSSLRWIQIKWIGASNKAKTERMETDAIGKKLWYHEDIYMVRWKKIFIVLGDDQSTAPWQAITCGPFY